MPRLDPSSLGQHLDALYRAAWALCGSREDAEDLVQETFTRVLARPRTVKSGGERAYLMSSLRNTFYSSLRSASRRPRTTATLEDVSAAEPRTAVQPERAAEVNEIFEAVSRLPEDFRLALAAVDILGLSYGEAAVRARRSGGDDHDPHLSSSAAHRPGAGRSPRPARGPGRIRPESESCLMEEKMTDDSKFPEAELARLADGSLPASREAELREELGRRPELTSALAEQERAMTMLRSDATPAPASLHRWVQDQTTAATPRRSRRRLPQIRLGVLVPVVTTAMAAAVILLVVVIANNGAGSPSLNQATRLALSTPTAAAPAEATRAGARSTCQRAGCRSPTGATRLAGTPRARARTGSRDAPRSPSFTVGCGHTVGYTIVTGAPVPVTGGQTVTRGGVPYTFIGHGPARLVTWVRGNHTCVIAGRCVTNATLLKLATADIPT